MHLKSQGSSAELARLVHDFVRGAPPQLTQQPAWHGARWCFTHAGRFEVTIANVPDDRAVMLFAEAGRTRPDNMDVRPDQPRAFAVLSDSIDTAPTGNDTPRGIVVHDRRTGTCALVSTMPTAEMDTPRFDSWLRTYLDELAELGRIVDEVALEARRFLFPAQS
jgi:hypothetical protein